MVTNPHLIAELEDSFQRGERLTLEAKFALLNGMYSLASNLGQFTPARALEGIEHIIHLTATIQSVVRATPP